MPITHLTIRVSESDRRYDKMRDLLCKALSLQIKGEVELGFYDEGIWKVEETFADGEIQNLSSPTTHRRKDPMRDLLIQALSLQIKGKVEVGCCEEDIWKLEQTYVDGQVQILSIPTTTSKSDPKVVKVVQRSSKKPKTKPVTPPSKSVEQEVQSRSNPNDDQGEKSVNNPEKISNDEARDESKRDQDLELDQEDTQYDEERIKDQDIPAGNESQVSEEEEEEVVQEEESVQDEDEQEIEQEEVVSQSNDEIIQDEDVLAQDELEVPGEEGEEVEEETLIQEEQGHGMEPGGEEEEGTKSEQEVFQDEDVSVKEELDVSEDEEEDAVHPYIRPGRRGFFDDFDPPLWFNAPPDGSRRRPWPVDFAEGSSAARKKKKRRGE